MGPEHLTTSESDDARRAVEHAARASRARLIALLASATGDLALAEDAVGTAFERSLTTWPRSGVPDNPEGWLLTVARNYQRDTWKSAGHRRSVPLYEADDRAAPGDISPDELNPRLLPDRRLELLFVCAHPAIDPAARTPLMLQTVLGFEAADVARAFAVPAATMAQRLVRAKRRIKDAHIRFSIPGREQMPERLPVVLEAVYGCFAIAWNDADGIGPDTAESMAGEALYLAVTLASLIDDDPEAWALAALIALSLARASARLGDYVPLDEQDPLTWDPDLIADGEALLRRADRLPGPLGRFQIEAAMQAVHAARTRTGETDWAALRTLSSALVRVAPNLGARVAHAAILARTDGAAAGLVALDQLAAANDALDRFQPFHAVRAKLLQQNGNFDQAREAYQCATRLSTDERVTAWLLAQADADYRT